MVNEGENLTTWDPEFGKWGSIQRFRSIRRESTEFAERKVLNLGTGTSGITNKFMWYNWSTTQYCICVVQLDSLMKCGTTGFVNKLVWYKWNY